MEKVKKLRIRMLSEATSVEGQGVGSAYLEQVRLIKKNDDIFKVYEKGDKGKADIYHVHTVNPKFKLRMNKHHVNVIYVHFLPTTLDGSIHLPKLAFNIFKKYVISIYKKADEIVVVNPIFIKPLVELGMKEENITYIPNYVSPTQFFPLSKEKKDEIREKYGIDKNAFVVLGVGQVQTRKGVLDFVEVAKRNVDKTFVWAGGFSFGKMTDGYKQLKEIMDNPPANVKFLGIIKRKDMNEIFNMASLLFMPSFAELFPMSILEAASTKTPILLRDLDLYKDILFSDYLVGNDVSSFSSEIEKLSNDPNYYQMALAKSEHIASYYCEEAVSKMWREYYFRIYNKWASSKKKKLIKPLDNEKGE
ncbi:MAG TPA: glycosyltransferase [Firmicutes bacterium]|nr:glycosyltransferase [Bacillota bacterium]